MYSYTPDIISTRTHAHTHTRTDLVTIILIQSRLTFTDDVLNINIRRPRFQLWQNIDCRRAVLYFCPPVYSQNNAS